MRIVSAVILGIMFMVLNPQSVTAQCHDEESCVGSAGPGGHTLDGETNWAKTGYHTTCEYCVMGTCHGPCNPEEEEEDRVAYLEAVSAVTDGDFENVMAIAERGYDWLVVNIERGSIQLLGCTGSVIASAPISNTAVNRLLRTDPVVLMP